MAVENWDRVKWARSAWITTGGTITIDLHQWDGTAMNVEDFNLSMIILTLLYGTPWKMQVGVTPGGDEIMFETDISSLQVGVPICVSIDKAMEAGQNTLYFTIPMGNFTVDVIFIQRVGA